jgi:predicted metal-dependent phosphoesterase TrpH
MSIAETVAAVHEQGGTAILAHPGEVMINFHNVLRFLRHPEVLLEWGVDAIETHNAGTMTPGNNWLTGRIGRQLPLPAVGNSDAHTLTAIGRGITRFQGRTAADFRSALAGGQTVVEGSSWPIIDYLKLSPGSIHKKLKLSSEPN